MHSKHFPAASSVGSSPDDPPSRQGSRGLEWRREQLEVELNTVGNSRTLPSRCCCHSPLQAPSPSTLYRPCHCPTFLQKFLGRFLSHACQNVTLTASAHTMRLHCYARSALAGERWRWKNHAFGTQSYFLPRTTRNTPGSSTLEVLSAGLIVQDASGLFPLGRNRPTRLRVPSSPNICTSSLDMPGGSNICLWS